MRQVFYILPVGDRICVCWAVGFKMPVRCAVVITGMQGGRFGMSGRWKTAFSTPEPYGNASPYLLSFSGRQCSMFCISVDLKLIRVSKGGVDWLGLAPLPSQT